MRVALKFVVVIFAIGSAIFPAARVFAGPASGSTKVPGGDAGPAKPMPRPKLVKSIVFKQGTSKISELKTLDRFARWLQFKQDVTDIRLEGFHCEADRKKEGVSSEDMLDYLLFMARERAEAVRAALIARGMEGRNFQIVPLGMADDPGVCKVIAMAMEPEKKPEAKVEAKSSKPDDKAEAKASANRALKEAGTLGKN